jgi:UDP-N-acetylglucosamine diphosphorylase/glucosamine-1-phosphate N-acetyltransferase
MHLLLIDGVERENLLPFTFTRPVSEIRVGILTITEKWERAFSSKAGYLTQDYLQSKYKSLDSVDRDVVLINGSICPDLILRDALAALSQGQSLYSKDIFIGANIGKLIPASIQEASEILNLFEKIEYAESFLHIQHCWDIFSKNGQAFDADFAVLTRNRISEPISASNKVIKPENIFLEEGAVVECSILNASTGKIYLGKKSEVMEGSIIRGPFALCEESALKLGTKIYGPTTIGPHSKVGGEVNNSVIFGYSNKAHDGFLGNSVIGEWCNLGADTNNSNLKNNYGQVQIYNYAQKAYVNTGLQFCGLMMGDHSKSGINTMFNTGTVVGVSANIFGAGFPDKHIPSFSWGGAEGLVDFKLEKAIELAQRVYERRKLIFDDVEQGIFHYLHPTKK